MSFEWIAKLSIDGSKIVQTDCSTIFTSCHVTQRPASMEKYKNKKKTPHERKSKDGDKKVLLCKDERKKERKMKNVVTKHYYRYIIIYIVTNCCLRYNVIFLIHIQLLSLRARGRERVRERMREREK